MAVSADALAASLQIKKYQQPPAHSLPLLPLSDLQCEACEAGQYTTAACTGAGAVDATQCFDCPTGTFSADGYECYQVCSLLACV